MEDIDYISLIHKSLTGQITTQENRQLEEWINASPHNRNEYTEIKLIWDEPIKEEPFLSEEHFLNSKRQFEASLTRLINNEKSHRFTSSRAVTIYIAVFLLSVSVHACYYYFTKQTAQQLSSYSIESVSPRTVRMSDSSTVAISDSTRLVNRFSTTHRLVNLQGTAFFNVKKEERPFIIQTSSGSIQVKGTAFYVHASASKPLQVFVLNGLVEVTFDDYKWTLQKGQYLSLADSSDSKVTNRPDLNFDSWITEKLEFRKTPLKEVINEIEKFYDIQCELPAQLEACRFTGVFDHAVLEDVFKALSYTLEITFTPISKNRFLVSGKGCSP